MDSDQPARSSNPPSKTTNVRSSPERERPRLIERAPAELNEMFRDTATEDCKRLDVPPFITRWLFAERLAARNERSEMSFAEYVGPAHIAKFFAWHRRAEFVDYFRSESIADLEAASVEADIRVRDAYGLSIDGDLIKKIARYNAQDYIFQRAYDVPARQKVSTVLDFGAGHGRLANLAFGTPRPGERTSTYVGIDGIPSSYFTQYAYYLALGLSVWEYFEYAQDKPGAEVIAAALEAYDVVHLPTWCLPLVPAESIDMICCVQVLKELPGEMVPWILPHFGRVAQAAGALYVRDHEQFHNPNHMPIELLTRVAGFALEFSPMLKDRSEVHGVPRIWRKVDPSLYI